MQGPKILNKTLLGKALFYIFAFIQYYPVIFKVIGVSTRILSSFIGIGILLIHLYIIVDKKRTFHIHKNVITLLVPAVAIILTTWISMYINSSPDNYFVKYMFTPTIMLFAAYNTIMLGKWAFGADKIDFKFIIFTLVKVVMVQDVLSVIMYVMPSVKDFLYSLIMLDPIEQHEFGTEGDSGNRLPGFGANFMNLGVANNAVLLLIAILIKNARQYDLNIKALVALAFSFIYISVIGLMQARTTMVGTGLGVLYLFASTYRINLNSFAQSLASLFKLLVFVAILAWIALSIFPDTISKHEGLLNYGFEMFISLKNKGTLETGSGNVLKSMYVYPDNIKSWVIGDAHFLAEIGFYKGTDVGWIRLINYFGIIGALIYYTLEYLIIFQSLKPEENKSKLIVLYFFALILITQCKSFTEITTYVALFWAYNVIIREPREKYALKKEMSINNHFQQELQLAV